MDRQAYNLGSLIIRIRNVWALELGMSPLVLKLRHSLFSQHFLADPFPLFMLITSLRTCLQVLDAAEEEIRNSKWRFNHQEHFYSYKETSTLQFIARVLSFLKLLFKSPRYSPPLATSPFISFSKFLNHTHETQINYHKQENNK
jgi:hypothetical protein